MTNRHKSISAQVIPVLRKIFAERRPFTEPGLVFSHGERSWSLSPEEARDFHAVVKAISSQYPTVHQKTVASELQKFCCEHIETNGAQFESRFSTLLNHLDNLTTISNIAYVQVSGIRLEVPDFTLGHTKLITSANPEIDQYRLSIKDKGGNPPAPINPDITLARVEVIGEPAHASDAARSLVQESLDCLQFVSIQDNYAAFNDSFGFMLACSSPIPVIPTQIWMYSDKQPTWTYSQVTSGIVATDNPRLNLPLNPQSIEAYGVRGLKQMNSMLSDPTPSSFDDGIRASISWIAYSIRERNPTRKYLGFFIALEALFSRDTVSAKTTSDYQAPSISVDEGVAYLLGKDPPARMRLANRVRELSRTRNMIVHRGYTDVERSDLLTLAHYSWNCCHLGLTMRDQFREDNSFRNWCQMRKYGAQ